MTYSAPVIAAETPLLPLPTDAAELERCLRDPEWRLFSGCLYKIIVKGDDKVAADGVIEEGESFVLPFRPNRAQRRFMARLWHRNVILKARQLGFTTLIALVWLDHALFNANQRCGMIAQDRDAAEAIFRDKVKFAYDNLPAEIRQRFPLATDSKTELLFAHNNSSVRVGTSMRSGTYHRLHISEFGKICAKYPQKAAEVITGSIPAVPLNGILVIESTAEGKQGEFYDICNRAQSLHHSSRRLTERDYRFHFFPWWQEPKYTMDPSMVAVSREQHEYFEEIEQTMGCKIDPGQRAWYVATLEADFSSAEERMWQEYPSTPEEAFQVSTKGNYYAKDMVLLRKRGGITEVPVLDLPVYTFWDIGNSDGTAIWFMQLLRNEDRFIGYYEEHGEDLRHYVAHLQAKGYLFGAHFLPHDADHRRLSDTNRSTKQQLESLMPGQTFFVVPRITELITGIYAVRKHIKGAYFDRKGCEQGIARIQNYRKKYSESEKRYLDVPDKSNGCSEGADALRQWAQAKEMGLLDSVANTNSYQEAPPPDWRG
ncbi:terminase [Paracidovorax avenae]|uniref:terminase n=1 Tax=Paracidovorax avenae TaxID=80867 RepID=UPI000D210F65|nr:terminase [Paracidovorax avenae]AVS68141.1 terminase [Paracidovorax avenae]